MLGSYFSPFAAEVLKAQRLGHMHAQIAPGTVDDGSNALKFDPAVSRVPKHIVSQYGAIGMTRDVLQSVGSQLPGLTRQT